MKKPFIVPVFIPHIGCPFQCAFCNQKTLTSISRTKLSEKDIRSEIESFLKWKDPSKKSKTEIAFYGGTFLGLEKNYLISLLDIAESYIYQGKIDSIRFSTRPDTINKETLSLLKNYSVKTVEIGVQSLDDDVLIASNRGHSKEDVIKALDLLRKTEYKVGMQLMTGLPMDSEEKSIKTAIDTASLKPDIVRIYPALVLKNSPMEKWYKKGLYKPLSLKESINIVKKQYLILISKGINVIRIGIQTSKDLEEGSEIISGPYHPSYGHMISSAVFLDMINLVLEKNPEKIIEIAANPRKISEVRGLKNSNIEILKEFHGTDKIKIVPDERLEMSSLIINKTKTDISVLAEKYIF